MQPAVDELVDRFHEAHYIKLGEKNSHAKDCFRSAGIYIGYHTNKQFLDLLTSNPQPWDVLRAEIEARSPSTKPANLTADLNQMRAVIDDRGLALWFTFDGTYMHWTFIKTGSPTLPWSEDGGGGRRETIGWRQTSLKGRDLHIASVTTRISQVQAYQRTVRSYKDAPDADGFNPVAYLRHLIRGDQQPAALAAVEATRALKAQVLALIRTLTHKEFENFVDLLMVSDGWLRQTEVGGTMKDVDGEYVHATTGLVAKVQVKSKTSAADIRDSGLLNAGGDGVLLYWVFHTAPPDTSRQLEAIWGASIQRGDVPWFYVERGAGKHRLLLLGPEPLADLAVRKGLSGWLVQKAS